MHGSPSAHAAANRLRAAAPSVARGRRGRCSPRISQAQVRPSASAIITPGNTPARKSRDTEVFDITP